MCTFISFDQEDRKTLSQQQTRDHDFQQRLIFLGLLKLNVKPQYFIVKTVEPHQIEVLKASKKAAKPQTPQTAARGLRLALDCVADKGLNFQVTRMGIYTYVHIYTH